MQVVSDNEGAYQEYTVKVAAKINTKLAEHKFKASELLTSMCIEDDTLKSNVEGLIKKACEETAPQSEIVQQIINRTCKDTVPRV